ncbi:tRNA methyltransferase [Pelomyxa schiedti]|nr:tRNA methyltransferase [Pelomyxa schiedti]
MSKATGNATDMSPEELEEEHVHRVYDEIADHFSRTRYKPWPRVEQFIAECTSTNPHCIIADIGCGNGKYLGVSSSAYCIGSDRCANLVDICGQKGFECVVGDNQSIPFRDGSVDAILSIAVIHHFASDERRLLALKELVRILRVTGKILISVWAHEQPQFKELPTQEAMITWKLTDSAPKKKGALPRTIKEFQRYYHLFKSGELASLLSQVPQLHVDTCEYDHDNWYAIATKVS